MVKTFWLLHMASLKENKQATQKGSMRKLEMCLQMCSASLLKKVSLLCFSSMFSEETQPTQSAPEPRIGALLESWSFRYSVALLDYVPDFGSESKGPSDWKTSSSYENCPSGRWLCPLPVSKRPLSLLPYFPGLIGNSLLIPAPIPEGEGGSCSF